MITLNPTLKVVLYSIRVKTSLKIIIIINKILLKIKVLSVTEIRSKTQNKFSLKN